ncbi:unnamed protein product [Merluccius merluccius]
MYVCQVSLLAEILGGEEEEEEEGGGVGEVWAANSSLIAESYTPPPLCVTELLPGSAFGSPDLTRKCSPQICPSKGNSCEAAPKNAKCLFLRNRP